MRRIRNLNHVIRSRWAGDGAAKTAARNNRGGLRNRIKKKRGHHGRRTLPLGVRRTGKENRREKNGGLHHRLRRNGAEPQPLRMASLGSGAK